MRKALVVLHARTGMDDQLVHGVLVVKLQNALKLHGVCEADARLDGNLHGAVGVDFIEHAFKLRQIEQQARALAFAGHRTGRAADVQVDLLIAHVRKDLRCPEKVIRALGEHLRYGGNAGVVVRADVALFPAGQAKILRGADEGDEVLGNACEMRMVHAAVDVVGHTFHGRKVDG